MSIYERVASAIRRVRPTDRAMLSRGRHVLITGGSRGLGLQLAREFGTRGTRVPRW